MLEINNILICWCHKNYLSISTFWLIDFLLIPVVLTSGGHFALISGKAHETSSLARDFGRTWKKADFMYLSLTLLVIFLAFISVVAVLTFNMSGQDCHKILFPCWRGRLLLMISKSNPWLGDFKSWKLKKKQKSICFIAVVFSPNFYCLQHISVLYFVNHTHHVSCVW